MSLDRNTTYAILFQFHKVRLKASSLVFSSVRTEFQFHKVRLKAIICYVCRDTTKFQFHKVRLKVYADALCPSGFEVSIP